MAVLLVCAMVWLLLSFAKDVVVLCRQTSIQFQMLCRENLATNKITIYDRLALLPKLEIGVVYIYAGTCAYRHIGDSTGNWCSTLGGVAGVIK